MPESVLCVRDCNTLYLHHLLIRYKLNLHILSDSDQDIPGSYWGDAEAGLILNNIYVRKDTPVHSLLHETCHYICMDEKRRNKLNTNAEGDYDEENAVCYLQILLSNDIPEMGQSRMMQDMDAWGYTFRLGSARKWFYEDSEDTVSWLYKHQLIINQETASYRLRR